MTTLKRIFDLETRTLKSKDRCYVGQVYDHISTKLEFTYNPINALTEGGYTAYILFDLYDDAGNIFVFGPGSSPRFDGRTFEIPTSITSRITTQRLDYQIWLIKNRTEWNGRIEELGDTEYLFSARDSLAFKPTTRCRSPTKDPCRPPQPNMEPGTLGWVNYLRDHAVLTPFVETYGTLEDGTEGVTIHIPTYNEDRDQDLALHIPYLDSEGLIDIHTFLRIVEEYNPDVTHDQIMTALCVQNLLDEKLDKVAVKETWESITDEGIEVPSAGLARELNETKLDRSSVIEDWNAMSGELEVPSAILVKDTIDGINAISEEHIVDYSNPHKVTKAQVGLANVDDTADVDKPVSTPQQAALNLKVDKVPGKTLSSEDFTTALKTKLSELYSKEQIDALITAIPRYAVEVVSVLPTSNISPTTIYLVPKENSENNSHDEFIYINGEWELIGSTEFKLTIVQNSTGITINDIMLQRATTGTTGLMTSSQVIALNNAATQTDLTTHTTNTNNPHKVTKAQVGLENVDNTSDLDKPISKAQQVALDKKVSVVNGMGLSTNDYTSADKVKLEGIDPGAQVNVIETIQVNGRSMTVQDKTVAIHIPTDNSELTNGAGYLTDERVEEKIATKADLSDLDSKQDILIAGANISIVDGTISAIGSGSFGSGHTSLVYEFGGNGETEYTLKHNLNTYNLLIQLRTVVPPIRYVQTEMVAIDTNSIKLQFSDALNERLVICILACDRITTSGSASEQVNLKPIETESAVWTYVNKTGKPMYVQLFDENGNEIRGDISQESTEGYSPVVASLTSASKGTMLVKSADISIPFVDLSHIDVDVTQYGYSAEDRFLVQLYMDGTGGSMPDIIQDMGTGMVSVDFGDDPISGALTLVKATKVQEFTDETEIVCVHNLNRYVGVQVYLEGTGQTMADITCTDLNTVTVSSNIPISGYLVVV